MMLLAVCAVALADTEYSLAPCPGSVTLRDNKIILTRTNLDDHADYLAKLGTSKESLLEDWEARGVVLQAWLEETKRNTRTCLEISVNADDEARRYYDVVNTKDRRRDYLNEVKSSPTYADAGYFFTEKVDWHQYKNKNYALRMTYKRTTDAGVYWGHMIKTVARGYTVVLDYRVYDRGLSSGDYGDLARAVNTLVFTDAVGEIPAAPAAAAHTRAKRHRDHSSRREIRRAARYAPFGLHRLHTRHWHERSLRRAQRQHRQGTNGGSVGDNGDQRGIWRILQAGTIRL